MTEAWEDINKLAELKLAEHGAAGSPERDGNQSEGPMMPTAATSPPADHLHAVDHALRDALCHPKNRASVLRLEAEVEAFVMGSRNPDYIFTADMSSYERLLAHRTAQHWGLETSTINQGVDQGRIVAYRTPSTRPPATKLADVPVTMAEPSGAAASNGGAAPRVLVRKRPDRLPGRGGMQGDGMQYGPMNGSAGGSSAYRGSVQERELEYNRRRAALGISDHYGYAGAAGAGAGAGGYQQQPGMAGATMLRVPGGMVNGASHAGQPVPGSMSPHAMQAAYSPTMGGASVGSPYAPGRPGQQGPGGPGAGGYAGGSSGGGSGRSKAQLRNREQDMADPDFRRGKHLHGQRFDPGFGEEAAQAASMYTRPTYSSEFPELAGGPAGPRQPPHSNGSSMGPPGAAARPGAGAGMAYGAAYAGQMPAHAGMMPQGMVPVPYGYAQGMLPPGMMAGPMAGMPGGMQVAGMYPLMPGMPGMVPVQPYGYMQPIRPGTAEGMFAAQQQMAAAAQQQMAAYQMAYATFPGAAMPAMPLSPTAAGHMPLSPTHGGGMHRQGSLGSRRNSGRYGGNGSHRGSASQTPRAELTSLAQPFTPPASGSAAASPRQQAQVPSEAATMPPAAGEDVGPTATQTAPQQDQQQQQQQQQQQAEQGHTAAAPEQPPQQDGGQ